MLTSIYNNTDVDDNDDMYIVIGIAQLSPSGVLKIGLIQAIQK